MPLCLPALHPHAVPLHAGYLFNIAFLRRVFSPIFVLHDIRRTGPLEVTTRWTMRMGLAVARGTLLRRVWDPRLTFTGTSIMGINPETGGCRLRLPASLGTPAHRRRLA
jgi:hypothetical protein